MAGDARGQGKQHREHGHRRRPPARQQADVRGARITSERHEQQRHDREQQHEAREPHLTEADVEGVAHQARREDIAHPEAFHVRAVEQETGDRAERDREPAALHDAPGARRGARRRPDHDGEEHRADEERETREDEDARAPYNTPTT